MLPKDLKAGLKKFLLIIAVHMHFANDYIDFNKIFLQSIEADWLRQNNVQLQVLRLDAMHPVVSGNKWFKLRYYLQEALQANAVAVATFGGAYSNHIIAAAYSCRIAGIKSIGIIRGEEPSVLSATLQNAKAYGMELHFVSRDAYREPERIKAGFENVYWISEGGYGVGGAAGAATMLSYVPDAAGYSHIVCATGTGTMMAGLIRATDVHQNIIGISVMKGNIELHEHVKALLTAADAEKRFTILHDFHFGGYAKHPAALIDFMNETWQQHQLPTDIIYTSKAFYATRQLIEDHTIQQGSNVLFVHSGGLQGNRSLPQGTLNF